MDILTKIYKKFKYKYTNYQSSVRKNLKTRITKHGLGVNMEEFSFRIEILKHIHNCEQQQKQGEKRLCL